MPQHPVHAHPAGEHVDEGGATVRVQRIWESRAQGRLNGSLNQKFQGPRKHPFAFLEPMFVTIQSLLRHLAFCIFAKRDSV